MRSLPRANGALLVAAWCGRVCLGQLDPEGGALTPCAGEADSASVRLDDLACERESEAGSWDPPFGRVAAVELGEDSLLVVSRDADPLVLDLDPDDPVAGRPGEADGAAL